MLRVFPTGAYIHRQPLAYPALAPLFRRDLAVAETARSADLVLFAHTKDIDAAPAELVRRLAAPGGPRAVLLSEEPFWDSVWGVTPWLRTRRVETPAGAFDLVTLNHHTSPIFAAERIPYLLLTDHRFAARYGALFARNAARSEAWWLAHLAGAPIRAAFVAETRRNAKFDVVIPQMHLVGLAAWRTRLAEAMGHAGVVRLGRGWSRGPVRQRLADWHFDKIRRLDGRCRMISALENTHLPSYLTEKLFDAFACGAVPLYYAAEEHVVHRVAGDGAWLNLHGLDPEAAAERANGFVPDAACAAAYRATQVRLAALFGSTEAVARERERLARAVIAELEAAASGGARPAAA